MAQIVKVKRRLYVADAPFSMKDKLKGAGCHWDAERRQWWIGATAEAEAELQALIQAASPAPGQDTATHGQQAPQDDSRLQWDRDHVLGTAQYDGKSYYLVGQGSHRERGPWVRLMFRDGSRAFFKAAAEVQIGRMYQEPRTLAALQHFAEKMRAISALEKSTGRCQCACHRRSDCTCPKFCHFHHDGCDRCGCES